MVKPIVRDTIFLAQKSVPATEEDKQVIEDLMDTMVAHRLECVGMAANMIGVNKRIIGVCVGDFRFVLINPKITKKITPFKTEESCLSREGVRSTTRYKTIEVEYLDKDFKKQKQRYNGYLAQIILHEYDHLEGIVI